MQGERNFCVYIMTNQPHGTLYVGVTNDIARRAYEHREGCSGGFTKRYGLKRLVYMESFPTATSAIHREKRIKKYSRAWKINLIMAANPDWRDLYDTLNG
ncbi:MAG TPA: GIY-YIG nuclease family protein [Rhizomicrobium sp.]|jgi:putative endonuclease|nr:GIY-YIG nuclease family protein [Rhizomicrobium sp.]